MRRLLGDTLGGLARLMLVAVLAASALVGVQATVAVNQPAEAADLSQFQPGNIIADELFFNPNTMSVVEIQAFLNSKVDVCRSGYTCLKDYRQTTQTVRGTPMCSTYTGAQNETAATIIYKVAQACGISPKVILVVLQKEQGLVTDTSPEDYQYRSAMGAGCPDTAACDSDYYGFFNQVHYGAYLLKRYTQPPGTGPGTYWDTRYDLWKPVGQVSNILYHPNSACGTKPVFIENQATHSLYIYTPYTPNQASLDAGYYRGDSCSTYGNRNFFNFYSDWFGSTQVPPLTNAAGGPTVLGVPIVGQFLNGWPGTISPTPDSVACVWSRAETVIADASDCLYQLRPEDAGQQLTVTVTSTKAGYQTLTQTSPPSAVVTPPEPPGKNLTPLSPARIAETRVGERTFDALVQGVGAVGPGQTLRVPVLGRAGVPASGVGAVALNVTVTGSTSGGFLTMYPTGESLPLASNLNFSAGQTIPNMVIAKVGADGSVSIYNSGGYTHVIVDITGWFPVADGYTPLSPARIAETRVGERTFDALVQGVGAVGPGQTLRVPVLGRAGVPASGVGAVALNVTVTGSTSGGFLTMYPTGESLPLASNLNFSAGQTIPNMVIAKVGADGSVSIYNSGGYTHVIVDITGWFPVADGYTPLSPARIAETRVGERTFDALVQGVGAVGPGQTLRVPVLGRAGVPASGVGAVALNVTVTGSTSGGFLTMYPTGESLPLASNLNFSAGQTIPNMVIAKVGADGSVSIYNSGGYTHVIVDVAGWFPE